MSGRLLTIWLKRGKRAPMDAVERAVLVPGRGLEGNADQGGRQVVLVERERWDQAVAELGSPVEPVARRGNLLIEGFSLEAHRGRVFRLGGCRLRLRGEVRPCERMEEARAGLRAALSVPWRAGGWAEILEGGEISVGDPLVWDDESSPDEARPPREADV